MRIDFENSLWRDIPGYTEARNNGTKVFLKFARQCVETMIDKATVTIAGNLIGI